MFLFQRYYPSEHNKETYNLPPSSKLCIKRTQQDGKKKRFREICEIAAIFVPLLTRANYRSVRHGCDNRVLRPSCILFFEGIDKRTTYERAKRRRA